MAQAHGVAWWHAHVGDRAHALGGHWHINVLVRGCGGIWCHGAWALLRLEYFSDIPRTSGRTPDVQLRAIDATLCIIGHLTPNLGECPNVFLFCYNSNISLISCGRPVGLRTSDSAQWPQRFLHYRTTRTQLGQAVWAGIWADIRINEITNI